MHFTFSALLTLHFQLVLSNPGVWAVGPPGEESERPSPGCSLPQEASATLLRPQPQAVTFPHLKPVLDSPQRLPEGLAWGPAPTLLARESPGSPGTRPGSPRPVGAVPFERRRCLPRHRDLPGLSAPTSSSRHGSSRKPGAPPLPGSASESQPVMTAAPLPNPPSTLRRWFSKPLPLLRSLETEETHHRLGDPL